MSPLQKAAITLVLGCSLAGPAAVARPVAPPANICLRERSTMPPAALAGSLEITAAQTRLLISAGKGALPDVRRQLAALPTAERHLWRQQALMFASQYGQVDVVAGLLDDGAEIEQTVPRPAFRSAVVDHLAPDLVAVAQATIKSTPPVRLGPVLRQAVRCGDEAMVAMLLRHGARADRAVEPNTLDMLSDAVVQGNARITLALLNHHADPCVFDRQAQRRATASGTSAKTLAMIGRREGLPAALTQRLSCREVPSHG